MKVLFFHNTLPAYRIPFFNALAKKINLEIVFTNLPASQKIYGENSRLGELKNCKYHVLDKNKDINSQIFHLIKNSNCELVHLPAPDGIYELKVSRSVLKNAKKLNKKTSIFWIRWTPDKRVIPYRQRLKNIVRSAVSGEIMRSVDVCLSAGQKALENYRKLGIPESKIKPMHYSTDAYLNSVPINVYQKYHLPENKKIILYFGRIVPRKGLMQLLRAYNEACSIKNCILVIAGDGDKQYIEKCKEYANNIHRSVYFLGRVDSKFRSSFFEQSCLFVLPSQFDKGIPEPWGQTVNEALQCGCKVLATDAVAAAYDLISNSNGIMCSAGNVKEMSQALVSLTNIPYQREEVKSTIQEYSCERMAQDFFEAFESVIDG